MRCALPSLAIVCFSLAAGAQSPVVRAHVEPAKGIMVGQPVRLVVSVLVPNYFTGTPEFPEFEIDNAIVVLPQETPQNSNERIGGITYAGITETYTIYPQQPGDFQVPPVNISVPYANAPPRSTVAQVALPALTFHADVPAAARDLDYFLPTTRLTMQQKWSAPLKNLRAGDAIERTITVTALMTQAMLIPPLPFTAPDGIRIYPEEPSVEDQKTDRGVFVAGRRMQSARYFIQKEGDYTLPVIELKWWNLSTNRLVTATLPALHFTAAANPNFVAELPPEPEPAPVIQPRHVSFRVRYRFWIRVRVILPCAIAFLFLFWMCRRYLPRAYRRLQAWRKRRQHSEPAYFRNLVHACRRNRAMQAYEWLLKWLALAHRGMTVDGFLSVTGGPALASETNTLGAALFRPNTQDKHWNGKTMADLLTHQRKKRITQDAGEQAFLNLNP